MRYDGDVVRNSELPPLGGFASLFARYVKRAADEAGLSGSEIGRRLGRAQSYASLRLNGRKAWTLDELDAIADMLGITPAELVERARASEHPSPRRRCRGSLQVHHDPHPHPFRLHVLILTGGSDKPSEPPFRERSVSYAARSSST